MNKEKEIKEDQLIELLQEIRKELVEIKERLEKQLVDKKQDK